MEGSRRWRCCLPWVKPSVESSLDGTKLHARIRTDRSTGSLSTRAPTAQQISFGPSDVSSVADSHRADSYVTQADPNCAGSMHENEVEMDGFDLHKAFDTSEIKPWQPERFELIQKVHDVSENHSEVDIMWDRFNNRRVAVKRIPHSWIRSSHAEFVAAHPRVIELPWQDIGGTKYLNSVGYPYACNLVGVYRDDKFVELVTECATEGDLFSWCGNQVNEHLGPGPRREAFIRPLVISMLSAIQQLHELSVVHLDISIENILLSKTEEGRMCLRLIDFGMASTSRYFNKCVRGKPQYQAPEVHANKPCDGFLMDSFSIGVTLYAICFKELPWLSTRPGDCQSFAYVQKRGFRRYMCKRKLRQTGGAAADHVSEALFRLLEGLLELDPTKRLTLGESGWHDSRRSVWDEEWLRGSIGAATKSQ